ncbi:hypothetical protein PUN28_016417 [Cardiocondyla obscurior]|uniref:Uncharacterized protein n=1 Tax=Cardiocondyla obscurior TaxID=286306 RepID=A0AAW2EM09_9HYME
MFVNYIRVFAHLYPTESYLEEICAACSKDTKLLPRNCYRFILNNNSRVCNLNFYSNKIYFSFASSRYPKGKLLPSMRTMNETIRKLRLETAILPKEIRAVRDFTKPHPTIPSRLVNSLREETNEGEDRKAK